MVQALPKVVVVVPTYNECETLPILVEQLAGLEQAGLHVLVVDDNSPDGTGAVADDLASGRPEFVAVLHRPRKAGLGKAYVAGMTRALADGADIVIQMDADLSHPVSAIPEMIDALRTTTAGVVIGSRNVPGGATAADWPLSRRLMSRWANAYVNAILRLGVADATAGFKAWRAATLAAVGLDSVHSNGYSFQVEMNHRAIRREFSILEVPIMFSERALGASKMSLRVQLESALSPWRLLFSGSGRAARAASSIGQRGRAGVLSRLLRLEMIVFIVAAACRLAVILSSGGFRGGFGYDAPVYFSAADALTRGRLPYRDFVMLHPPGLLLTLTPFAWLTRVMSDDSAFAVATLGFVLISALNAVLVMRVCRHLGFGTGAAFAGALFYATWFGAVGAEFLTKLEPLGNLFMLCALLAAVKAQQRSGWRLFLVAGAALGLAVSVKIWWIVPALGVMAWHGVVKREPRAGAVILAGAVGSALVINLPFFLAAPHQLFASVIKDQLGRGRSAGTLLARLADLSTVPRLLTGSPSHHVLVVAVVLAAAVFLRVVVAAWRHPVARPVIALVLVQLAVVLAAPSWFPYYCDYLAIALSITVAAAASRSPGKRRRPNEVLGWLPTAAAASFTLLILATGPGLVTPFRGAALLTHAVAGLRCVMTDAPMAQIELDALSRGLSGGCPNWIDDTGPTYGPDRAAGNRVPRIRNQRWQYDLIRYLRSGNAIIVVRGSNAGVSKRIAAAISRDGMLARAGGHTVYLVTNPAPNQLRDHLADLAGT